MVEQQRFTFQPFYKSRPCNKTNHSSFDLICKVTLFCASLHKSILDVQIFADIIGINLEKIMFQNQRGTTQHLRVDALLSKDAITRHTIGAEFAGKPTHGLALSFQLGLNYLSYVYVVYHLPLHSTRLRPRQTKKVELLCLSLIILVGIGKHPCA
jgi:hypothetical protein